MRNAIAMALVTALNLGTGAYWVGLAAQTPVGTHSETGITSGALTTVKRKPCSSW